MSDDKDGDTEAVSTAERPPQTDDEKMKARREARAAIKKETSPKPNDDTPRQRKSRKEPKPSGDPRTKDKVENGDVEKSKKTRDTREDADKPSRRKVSAGGAPGFEYPSNATSGESGDQGRTNTCPPRSTNMVLFCVAYAFLVLLVATTDEYFVAVLADLGRRYHFASHELTFIPAIEKIAMSAFLLFVGYYGNKMHKPLAMCVGGLIFAAGVMLAAVPYFLHKTREQNSQEEVVAMSTGELPNYLQVGLCLGTDTDNSTVGNDTVYGHEGPCPFYPYKTSERKLAYTFLCLGQLCMGIGGSFIATLGLVYIDENGQRKDIPLLLGIALSMRGLGQLVGSLLASKLIEIDEGLEDSVAIWEWHVGAWWLGLPVIALGFVICSPCLLVFPQWIHEPQWLIDRRARALMRLQRAEERRRRKQKELEAKKREDRRRKRRKLKRQAERQKREAERQKREQENADNTTGKLSNNIDGTDSATRNGTTADESNTESKANDTDKNKIRKKKKQVTLVNEDKTEAKKKEKRRGSEKPSSTEKHDSGQEDAKAKTNVTTSTVNELESEDTVDGVVTDEVTAEDIMAAEEEKRHKKKVRLGRQLQDLPQNLWYLLTRLSFTASVCGAAAASYLRSGHAASLPTYLHIQFHYPSREAGMAAAVSLGAASTIGAFGGGLLITKKKLTLYHQIIMLIGLLVLVTAGSGILMVFDCNPLSADLDSESGLWNVQNLPCSEYCDCSKSQYHPVCDMDGHMYPTPCHAGCTQGFLPQNEIHLNFTSCSCDGSGVTADQCHTRCVMMAPYMAVCFLMELAQGFGQVTLVLIFLRTIHEKLRSLSLGFAFWLIYILGYVPGRSVYSMIRDDCCLQRREDCHERDVCWLYDADRYRYAHNGATLAFSAVAVVCFLLTWWQVRTKWRTLGVVPDGSIIAESALGPPKYSRSRSASNSRAREPDSQGSDNVFQGGRRKILAGTPDIGLAVIPDETSTGHDNVAFAQDANNVSRL